MQIISEKYGTFNDITTFVIRSSKCMKAFQLSIETDAGAQKIVCLTGLCKTRWVDHNENIYKISRNVCQCALHF